MHPIIPLGILLLFSATALSAQSFTLTITPDVRTVAIGGQTTFTIKVEPRDGFNAPVALTHNASVNVGSLDRDTIRAPYDSVATLTVTAVGLKYGTHYIRITGRSGSIKFEPDAKLIVEEPPVMPPGRWTVYDSFNSDLPASQIRAIAFDRTGNGWIGTNTGLVRVKPGTRPGEVTMGMTVIHAISIDTVNRVWVSSTGGVSGLPIPDSIPLFGSAILRIANSPDGSQWLVSRFGLVRHRYGVWTKYTTTNSGLTSDVIIDAAVTSDGHLWAAVDAGPNGAEPGLVHFDGAAWTTHSVSDMGLRSDATPARIAIDRNDRLWLTTDDGLVVGDESGFAREDPGFAVNAVTSGGDGRIWVSSADQEAGSRRLAVHRDGVWTTYLDAGSGLRSGASFDILAVNNNDGSIWIGTEGGLVIFRPDIAAGVAEEPGSLESMFTVAPNPLGSEGTIELVSDGGMGRIRLFDNTGREVADLFQGRLEAGRKTIALDLAGVSDGAYLLALEIDGVAKVARMIMIVR